MKSMQYRGHSKLSHHEKGANAFPHTYEHDNALHDCMILQDNVNNAVYLLIKLQVNQFKNPVGV